MPEEISQVGILYHVTIGSNVDSIWSIGIDPNYSKGKFDASWYVVKDKILWAICHVANRHDCKLDDIFVCAVLVDWKHMRRTNLQGVYYTKQLFHAETFNPASWFVNEESNVI